MAHNLKRIAIEEGGLLDWSITLVDLMLDRDGDPLSDEAIDSMPEGLKRFAVISHERGEGFTHLSTDNEEVAIDRMAMLTAEHVAGDAWQRVTR